MKKIGIVSFPRYFNYGTYLQLFAMQQMVARLGFEPEIIDYDPYNDSGRKPDASPGAGGFLRGTVLRSVASRTLSYLRSYRRTGSRDVDYRQERNIRFAQFLSGSLRLGRKTYFDEAQLQADRPSCAAFIVGSDQVWHPTAHHEDSTYYLGFAERHQRIAYAPSFGVSEIPPGSRDWIRQRLLEIPHLSVRETAGAAVIGELTGRQVPVVLDPVFLVEPRDWAEFGESVGRRLGPYLLCYFLESDSYMRDRALAIARSLGLRPVMVPVHPRDTESAESDFEYLSGVGPREFVDLVRQAAFVCTDSFHGTAFSILFNRPFYTFRRYDNPYQAANHSRIDSILRIMGLEGRIRGIGQPVCDPGDLDFSVANSAIASLRRESLEYLDDALSIATRTEPLVPVQKVNLAAC
ncbi:MAG: polysaccharide pyruvyl transferase family protein [Gammaproteobacteria bacterium]|nr:polysaccharide pyruvyl transferase family protein [Gammaproteobacteria bacterium]